MISAVGQVDDYLLVSNDIFCLRLLVHLTEEYCAKYRIKLEPHKTNLLCYSSNKNDIYVKIAEAAKPIIINGTPVKLVTEAEHVGVLRSTKGNAPNILKRISEHKKALGSVLSAGLANGHRGNAATACVSISSSVRLFSSLVLPHLFSKGTRLE